MSIKFSCVTLWHMSIHCGYVVDHGLILHTTEKGVRVTPARAMKVLHFYAVKGE